MFSNELRPPIYLLFLAKVWSKDLVLRKEIQAHDYAVYHLLIQEGKLFSASIDSTIRVWQLPGLDAVSTLTNHEEPVRRLATNGLRLFSGDEAGNVRIKLILDYYCLLCLILDYYCLLCLIFDYYCLILVNYC